MPASSDRIISLSAEQADFIDQQIKSGAYASTSEIVNAGISALQERDAELESWLRKDVAATYDAMQADPSRAVSLKSVFDQIRDHHRVRMSRKA